MLHVVRGQARPLSHTLLRPMFAARKAVFVDLLKWQVPVVDGAFEIDQFDDGHATYLVVTDVDGDHLGSARLLPTTRPHILDQFFSVLCDRDHPCGERVFEITRFCLDRRVRARARRAVRDTLVAALADHALQCGIVTYTAIAEEAWCRQIMAFGWHCELLGDPRRLASGLLAALRIDIAPDTPRRLAAAGVAPCPSLLDPVRAAA